MIQYTQSHYKYQLAAPYTHTTQVLGYSGGNAFVRLGVDGLLSLSPGYAWDGPSGPAFDTKNFMRGSLVHDALYQLIRIGAIPATARKVADDELYRTVSEDGMSRLRAAWVYAGVRLFGTGHIDTAHEPQIQTAP